MPAVFADASGGGKVFDGEADPFSKTPHPPYERNRLATPLDHECPIADHESAGYGNLPNEGDTPRQDGRVAIRFDYFNDTELTDCIGLITDDGTVVYVYIGNES